MAERIVKFRLITWFETVDDPTVPGGKVMREKTASLGDTVDIPDDQVGRLDELGALYTAEEQAQIEAGEYTGFDRYTLQRFRSGQKPAGAIAPVEGEGADTSSLDAQELGEYIKENGLTVQQTLDLLPEDADEDAVNKLYDAEAIASDNEPRKGVTDRLDARLAALAAA